MDARGKRKSSGDVVRAGEPDSAAKALGIGRGKPVLERGPETSDVVGDGASIVRGGLAQNGSVLGQEIRTGLSNSKF